MGGWVGKPQLLFCLCFFVFCVCFFCTCYPPPPLKNGQGVGGYGLANPFFSRFFFITFNLTRHLSTKGIWLSILYPPLVWTQPMRVVLSSPKLGMVLAVKRPCLKHESSKVHVCLSKHDTLNKCCFNIDPQSFGKQLFAYHANAAYRWQNTHFTSNIFG